jgi:peptide/nickel transport system substrate-binding protein
MLKLNLNMNRGFYGKFFKLLESKDGVWISMNNKKAIGKIAAIIIVVILAAAIGGGVYYYQYTQKVASIKNPDTIIEATIGEPETLDPAWAYDTASGEVIFNIYDTLIFFDREKVDAFVPKIAEQVPSVANGLVKDDGKTIIFPIRQGIKTHGGGTITPEDVEYSFERAMIQSQSHGPIWMILDPLLGVYSLEDLGDLSNPTEAANIGEMIDAAVKVDGNNVVFKLAKAYPLTTFLQIWSQTWASIVDKESAVEHGAWPGNKDNWVQIFATYHDPEEPELQEADCGSGPFKLESWTHGQEVSLVRFDDYWAGPAKIKRAVIKFVDEWATRKLMFLQGDVDIAYVPRQYISEVDGAAGIRCVKDLPSVQLDAVFFNFEIDPSSPYIGSGKLDGNGIPPNFFSDINVRKAFAYSFDWKTYIAQAMLGEAKQVPGPIPEGFPYFNPNQEMYQLNLTKAEEYFKAAWDGQVWEKGFTIEVLYNTGNLARKTAAEILKTNIESLNPKFHVTVTEVDWGTVYIPALRKHTLTLFIIGWLADYPDPHNFVFPFMHSSGDYALSQGYSNSEADELIERGISESDPAVRQEIYYRLQEIYFEDVPSFIIDQPLVRHWERDWVQGWYYNPIYPGLYFYVLSKGY